MIYYKAPDNSVHAIENKNFENLLPIGCVEVSKEEAKQLAAAWILNNPILIKPVSFS
jgi:hypothetical protein